MPLAARIMRFHMSGNRAAVGWVVIIAAGILFSGCASSPPPVTEPPVLDPVTATPEYWLAKPAAASVYGEDFDKLWSASAETAHNEFFTIDRQDYRDGLLTTRPLISKQIWEFWRSDAGDEYYAWQNSLQTIRRTIQFEFDRQSGGATVSPKVLIERFSQPNRRITSTGEYRRFFTPQPTAAEASAVDKDDQEYGYWYSVGRDYAMEAELASAIKLRLAKQ
jgi:hypothetical protein